MPKHIPILIFLTILISGCSQTIPTETPANIPLTITSTSTSSDAPDLVFFVSEQGKFQVRLPVFGNIMEFSTTRTFFGVSTECFVTYSRLNSAGASIQYCDLNLNNIGSPSDIKILEEVRDRVKIDFRWLIEKEQFELVEDTYQALTLSGQENMRGLDYDGTFKARITLVENRVYTVHMSVYHENWCNCFHQMDQVVDSFFVDSDLSIPYEPTP